MNPEDAANDEGGWTRIDIPSGRDVHFAEAIFIEVDDDGEVHYRPGKLPEDYEPPEFTRCGTPYIQAEVRRKKRRAFWRRLLARVGVRIR